MIVRSTDLRRPSAPITTPFGQVLLWLPQNQPLADSLDSDKIRQVDSLVDLRSTLGSCEARLLLLHLDRLSATGMARILNEINGISGLTFGFIARKPDFPKALALARQYNIGIILPEHNWHLAPDGLEWLDWLNPDYPPDLFAPSFDPGATRQTIRVRNIQDKKRVGQVFDQLFGTENVHTAEYHDGRLVLEELLNNAIFHAFVDKEGREKYTPGQFSELQYDEKIVVRFFAGGRWFVFSVFDNGGHLDCGKILKQIERRMLSRGLFDKSGRGLYLVYALSHRWLVHLTPGRQTELISFFSRNPRSAITDGEPKPILIFESRARSATEESVLDS